MVDHLDTILGTSHNRALLKEANALLCAISKNQMFPQRKNMKEKLNLYLDSCGLLGIWTSTSFKATVDRENRCAELTDKLIDVGCRALPRPDVILTCHQQIIIM